MPLLYGRKIRVTVAGLVIEDPRIAVELEREIDRSQDKGIATIYNLAPGTTSRLEQRGNDVRIEAGYRGTVAIIFEGDVQRVRLRRDRLAHRTELTLGDRVRSVRRLSGSYNRSFAGPVSVREIMVDICSYGLELPVSGASLELIPEAATSQNFYWAGLPATGALNALLQPLGLTWFEADGVVRINAPDKCQPDAPRITVSADLGMVRTPKATDQGWEVDLFCEPRAVLGGEVDFRTDTARGLHKIVGVRHALDNWDGPFTTTLTTRELPAAPQPG